MPSNTKRESIVLYASLFFVMVGGLTVMLLFMSILGSVTGVGPSTRITQQQLLPFIIGGIFGFIIGSLAGGYAWLLIMRRFATPDEVYRSLVHGGWVPILTPLTLKLFRRYYDEQTYRPSSWLSLISKLERSGFYKYTEPVRVEEAQAYLARTGDPFHFSTRRAYDFDAEELSNGGIADFFTLVGIEPIDVKQGFTDGAYSLYVNDNKYEIYSQNEVETEEDIWLIVRQRTLAMLNEFLENGKAEERAYLLPTGDRAVFLTPEQNQIIWNSNLILLSEKPLNANEQLITPGTNNDSGHLSAGG